MDFFDRFIVAFNNSKIEYEHSLPICNDKYEFLFFFDCINRDDKCFVNTIDSVYIRNINDSTVKHYNAAKIIPEKCLAMVTNREIVPMGSADEEIELEEAYFNLYENYYNSQNPFDKTFLLKIEDYLKKIPISKCMLEIYAFLMQFHEE